jgi:hypothetical protein
MESGTLEGYEGYFGQAGIPDNLELEGGQGKLGDFVDKIHWLPAIFALTAGQTIPIGAPLAQRARFPP